MPTYDYRCSACGDEFEHFQPITEKPIRKCKKCDKLKLVRLIGTGGGIIFKGTGFYQTDYRSKNYSEQAKKESSSKEPDKKAAGEKSDKKKKKDNS